MFFVCPSRSHIIISKTRDQMWSSLKLFNGHVRMASDVSSDKHILLWHQIAPELCCVLCSVVYWPLYKSTESAWQGRIVGRSENLAGQQIFFHEKEKLLLLWLPESGKGGSTSPPVLPPFPTALAWQGGGGFHHSLLDPIWQICSSRGHKWTTIIFIWWCFHLQFTKSMLVLPPDFFFFECSLSFFFGVRNRKPSNNRLRDYKIQGSAKRCSKSGFFKRYLYGACRTCQILKLCCKLLSETFSFIIGNRIWNPSPKSRFPSKIRQNNSWTSWFLGNVRVKPYFNIQLGRVIV